MPNPLLPIYIERIHKDKHGSDTAAYDTEGRFANQIPIYFNQCKHFYKILIGKMLNAGTCQ